ncbi:Cell division protein ZapA [Parelusimicrobium proximum]|uniref:hypothetical protein n=1 Tax=Parelusimicrobium proximum TaxID=3228953 RepID=UPI003D16FD72
MKRNMEVYVKGIRLEVDTERIGPMEIPTVIEILEKKMSDLSASTGLLDSLQLAYLAAMEFAAEIYLRGQDSSTQKREDTQVVDELILKLQNSLSSTLPTK